METTNSDEIHFNSKSLGLRAQKKLLGKMAARNVAKHFINDEASRLLDNLYRILKDFYNKREAEKVVKNVIKMSIKVGILTRNNKFSNEELRLLDCFEKKFRQLILTIVSFHEVAYSYDRTYITPILQSLQHCLQELVRSNLSEKSLSRIEMIFGHLANVEFMDSLFKVNGKYCDILAKSVCDLRQLLDGES